MILNIKSKEKNSSKYAIATIKHYHYEPGNEYPDEVISKEPFERLQDEEDKDLILRALSEIANSDKDKENEVLYDMDKLISYTIKKKLITIY